MKLVLKALYLRGPARVIKIIMPASSREAVTRVINRHKNVLSTDRMFCSDGQTHYWIQKKKKLSVTMPNIQANCSVKLEQVELKCKEKLSLIYSRTPLIRTPNIKQMVRISAGSRQPRVNDGKNRVKKNRVLFRLSGGSSNPYSND